MTMLTLHKKTPRTVTYRAERNEGTAVRVSLADQGLGGIELWIAVYADEPEFDYIEQDLPELMDRTVESYKTHYDNTHFYVHVKLTPIK